MPTATAATTSAIAIHRAWCDPASCGLICWLSVGMLPPSLAPRSFSSAASVLRYMDLRDAPHVRMRTYVTCGAVQLRSSDPAHLACQGAERNRTAVRGFAGLCLTTRPRRPAGGHRSRGSADLPQHARRIAGGHDPRGD